MADAAETGLLHGNTITLDTPVPPLDGRRVRVIIAPVDDDARVTTEEKARCWDEWVHQDCKDPFDDGPECP